MKKNVVNIARRVEAKKSSVGGCPAQDRDKCMSTKNSSHLGLMNEVA
jgi:hypothetical protein